MVNDFKDPGRFVVVVVVVVVVLLRSSPPLPRGDVTFVSWVL